MATVVATRALSYTITAGDGTDLFAAAVRGEKIEVGNEKELERLRRRGSVAEPGSPEAEAATQPQAVGPGVAYMPLDEAAELAMKASGALSPGGSVARADAAALHRLDDFQLRVTAGALGLETDGVSREELVAAIHAGTGEQAATAQSNVARTAVDATDAALELAAAEGVDIATVAGTGHGGRVTKDDVQAAVDAQA